jgi:ABC-2 type transport system ATP-binding protein
MHALELTNLSKSYNGKEVVKKVSLSIQEGEIFGLLGPNGAGKSTTINMISGVTKVGAGTVRVFGKDNQADFVSTRRAVGVMHQEIVVDTFFTIDRALKIHSGYYGVKDDPKWRDLLVERLALGPHLKKSMNKLSGGMKRRFMVAKALIHKPTLLILDEPTAGVDVELRQNLWSFVREINKTMGVTVLLTTHYLEEAEEMCERVAIMNLGELIALDRTKDLLNKLEDKRMLIHLDQPIGEVPPSLKGFGAELLENGSLLKVPVTKQISTNSVLEAIAKAQLAVKDLETQAPNLQEAFLKLTRGKHA